MRNADGTRKKGNQRFKPFVRLVVRKGGVDAKGCAISENDAKRGRKAAGVHGKKATKRYHRERRAAQLQALADQARIAGEQFVESLKVEESPAA